MRIFTLVDEADNEYSLAMNTHFLYGPQGLGFEEENIYRQIGGNFILASTKPKQSVISANIHFGGNTPYTRYRDFIEFCSRPNLRISYYIGEQASKDKQKTTFKVYAGTSDGILVFPLAQAGTSVMYANATYDLQTGSISYTHVRTTISNVDTAVSSSVLVKARDTTEGSVYKLRCISNPGSGKDVYCNCLPFLGNTYSSSENYTTNQVFKTVSDSNYFCIYFFIRYDALAGQTIQAWIKSVSGGMQFYHAK